MGQHERLTMTGLVLVLAFFALCNGDCGSIPGYDLSKIAGKLGKLTNAWQNVATNVVDFAICATEPSEGCGSGNNNEMCANKPSCCGICQRWVDQDTSPQGACLGVYKAGSVVDGHVVLDYQGGDPVSGDAPPGPREGKLRLICDKSKTDPTPVPGTFVEPSADGHTPNTPYIYTLDVQTAAVCAGAGGSGVPGGGIFLILLFVGFIVYLIGGVAFNKFKEEKEGIELIPHVDFWRETPAYFIAGCQFCWGKISGGGSGYDTVS